MKTCAAVMVLALAMGGCSRESAAPSGGQGRPGPAADGAGGMITFAEIVAQPPPGDHPLKLQYVPAGGPDQPARVLIRWYVEGVLLDAEEGNVLERRHFRKGDRVEAEVIPVRGAAEGAPFRTAELIVPNTPPEVGSVQLSPVPAFPGDAVRVAVNAIDRDDDTVTLEYLWRVNNQPVDGGAEEISTAGLKRRDGISVTVTPFDGEDRGAPVSSTVLLLANRFPEITSVPASGMRDGVYTYQVAAADPDGDPVVFSLAAGPAGMTIDRKSGLLRWEPPRNLAGPVEMQVKIAADDGAGGLAFQEYSLTMELR